MRATKKEEEEGNDSLIKLTEHVRRQAKRA